MAASVGVTAAERYEELKRLLVEYTAYIRDLPPAPHHGADLGAAFEKCVLEARFVFPGLSTQQQEQVALVRLAGMNILGRSLMTRLSSDELARCGMRIEDKHELERVTSELEADFVMCRNQIVSNGLPEKFSDVQKMFWEEWSNPFQKVS